MDGKIDIGDNKSFDIDLITGRELSKQFRTDESQASSVDEASIRRFGFKSAHLAVAERLNTFATALELTGLFQKVEACIKIHSFSIVICILTLFFLSTGGTGHAQGLGRSAPKVREKQSSSEKGMQSKRDEKKSLRRDAARSRLFAAPTGRTLKRGELVFSDFVLFLPTLTYGLTDFLTLLGGVSIIPGARRQAVFLSPTIRFLHTDKIDLAAGALWLKVENKRSIKATFASVSIGGSRRSVTLGIGVPFDSPDISDDLSVILFVGAEVQVTTTLRLISENPFFLTEQPTFREDVLLISGGLRYIRNRFAVGIGLFIAPQAFGRAVPILPWLDFSIRLSKGK